MKVGRSSVFLWTGLFVSLGLTVACAQENLESGKSPAQIFASDCSVCHKSPQGLTKSGGLFGLDSFLREHYTSSRETARALAAYLQSFGEAAPAKPAPKRAAKPSGDKPKPAAKPGEAKPDATPASAPKPESKPPAEKPPEAKSSEPKPESKPESKPEAKPEAKPAEGAGEKN